MTRKAERATPVVGLGRIGMVCYGVVHVIVAYLGVRIAVDGSGESADKNGAVQQIASTSLGYRWRDKKRTRVFKRFGAVIRAAIATSIGISAITIASSGGAKDGDQVASTGCGGWA